MSVIKSTISYYLLFVLFFGVPVVAQNASLITFTKSQGEFSLVESGKAIPIVTDNNDYEVVQVAAALLQRDIQMVTNVLPPFNNTVREPEVIIVGSLDKCSFIQKFVAEGKFIVTRMRGTWESYQLGIVNKPYPGVKRAYVVCGSDARGTAYGILELSKQMGVSPWYWWADVPVKKQSAVYLSQKSYQSESPDVQYRGIFISDEQWGMGAWAEKVYESEVGALGPRTYAKVFELMLRLKSNYLWPSMKSKKGFYEVEGNKELAQKYAIVVGTSPQEPLHFNPHLEWKEEKLGSWDYVANKKALLQAWGNRLIETSDYENIYTLGMRKKNDREMDSKMSVNQQINLMQTIITDQRKSIEKYTNKPAQKIPQVVITYKEVLQQYNSGLSVPEDVTIVWTDDNYGYMSQVTSTNERKRSGGTGLYYHLNYQGYPQSYMWLSTVHPMLIWSELNKAYSSGARKLWVFNVGDIKPHEQQMDYCMDLAWSFPSNKPDEALLRMKKWYVQLFGENLGQLIHEAYIEYYRLAFQRKPEFMGWDRLEPFSTVVDTEFSFSNYNELQNRLDAYNELFKKLLSIQNSVPEVIQSAFFQLVYYPIAGSYFTNRKILLAQINRIYAKQKRSNSNEYSKSAKLAFEAVKHITSQYRKIENGKWDEMMSWESFDFSKMPQTDTIKVPEIARFGMDFEGSSIGGIFSGIRVLPTRTNLYKNTSTIEIFNKGTKPYKYSVKLDKDWIKLSSLSGECTVQEKLIVDIDWAKAPHGKSVGKIDIFALDSTYSVYVPIHHIPNRDITKLNNLIVEKDGYISLRAGSFDRKIDKGKYKWNLVKELGYERNAVTVFADTLESINYEWDLTDNAPSLEYDFHSFTTGWVELLSYTLPTHPLTVSSGCLYAVSIDNFPPKIIDFHTGGRRTETWIQNVQQNLAIGRSKHFIATPGKHTLKVWLIDPGVVFDKFCIDFGGLKNSYVGVPETRMQIK